MAQQFAGRLRCAHHWIYIQTKQTLENTYSKFAYCTNVQHRMRFSHFSQQKFSVHLRLQPLLRRCFCYVYAIFLPPEVVVWRTFRHLFWFHIFVCHSEHLNRSRSTISCRSCENKIKRLLFRIWRHVICTSGYRNETPYRRRWRYQRKKNKLKYSRYSENKYLQIPLQQHGARNALNSEIFQ